MDLHNGQETYRLRDLIAFNLGSNFVLRAFDAVDMAENGESDKILLKAFIDDDIKVFLPGLLFLNGKSYEDYCKQLYMKVEIGLGFAYSIRMGKVLVGMVYVDTPRYNYKTHGLRVWTIDFFLLSMMRKQGIMSIAIGRMLYLLKEKIGANSVYAMVDRRNVNCIKFLEKHFFEREAQTDLSNASYLYKCDLQTINFRR